MGVEASEGGNSTYRRARRRIHAGAWAGVAVGLIVLLVGSAAGAPAVTPATTMKYKAPYAGTEDALVADYTSGCGASGSFPVTPFFNLTTGHATAAVTAAATTCGSENDSSLSEALAEFIGKTFVAKAGAVEVVASWIVTFSSSLAATAGSVSQEASAYSDVLAFLFVEDASTDSQTSASNIPSVFYQISMGTYSHTYTGVKLTSYLNVTLVAGEKYYVIAEVEIVGDAFVTTGTGAGSASASVMMDKGVKHAILKSVTIV
jgi:hypothetical protein